MEVLIILLVAFIFLGPNQMVDAARLLGKAAREVRRLTAELPDLTLDVDDESPTEAPIVHRGGGPNPASAAPTYPSTQDEDDSTDDEGPVAFRRDAGHTSEDGTARPPSRTSDDADSTPKQDAT